MIQNKQFYRTLTGQIGYILHKPIRNICIMRLDNDEVVEFSTDHPRIIKDQKTGKDVYYFKQLSNNAQMKPRTQTADSKTIKLFIEPLAVEVIDDTGILSLYFPKSRKTLNFDAMCKAYIDKYDALICHANPYGFNHEILIDAGTLYPGQAMSDELSKELTDLLLSWLPENFDLTDYAIFRSYGYSQDIYIDTASQTGYSLWLNDATNFNLTKLKWNHIVSDSITHKTNR